MTIQEAIERLIEGVPELPANAVDYNRGYLAAIRDMQDIAKEEQEDTDNEHKNHEAQHTISCHKR